MTKPTYYIDIPGLSSEARASFYAVNLNAKAAPMLAHTPEVSVCDDGSAHSPSYYGSPEQPVPLEEILLLLRQAG